MLFALSTRDVSMLHVIIQSGGVITGVHIVNLVFNTKF